MIQQGTRAWLVGASESHRVAAAIRPGAFYHFLDVSQDSMVEVEFRDETKILFSTLYRLARHTARGRTRWLTFLDRSHWIEFLEKVGEFGLRLDVERNMPGGRILVVK